MGCSVEALIQVLWSCSSDLRRGWLLGGMPVSLKGIGGPGAPHVFDFQRFCNSGRLSE